MLQCLLVKFSKLAYMELAVRVIRCIFIDYNGN